MQTRRPILLILYAQVVIILVLYYLNPFGLGRLLAPKSKVLAASGLAGAAAADAAAPQSGAASPVATINGTVRKLQVKDYYIALTVDAERENVLVRIKGFPGIETTISAQSASTDLPGAPGGSLTRAYDLVGRTVIIRGEVSIPSARKNPGCFDYQLYLKGQGIYAIVDASIYHLEAGKIKYPLLHALSISKAKFYDAAKSLLGDEGFSITAGLMFGDKSYLDDDLYEQFQENGIAHVLAVSGLHVGLVYALIEKLFGGKKNYYTSALTIVLLYCYAALSSFSISVLRASFMILLRLIAFHTQRRYDLVCAASITAIVFLLINPYQLFDSGFQLSFVAAYTIGMAFPWAENKALFYSRKFRSEILYDVLSPVLPALCIHIGMAPLIAFHFLNYSFISIFINPIAIALASLLLPAGLLLYTSCLVPIPIIQNFCSIPSLVLSKALNILNNLASRTHLSGSVCAPPFGLLIIFYVFFFYFLSETRYRLNRKNEEKSLASLAAALTISVLTLPFIFGITDSILPWSYSTPSLTFVDVGQGDCAHINIDGYNVLIDGGGNYYKNIGKDTLKPYLLKNGIHSVDLAIVTHKDQDHSKGIYELADCFDVKKILLAGQDNDDCAITGINIDGIKVIFMADATKQRELSLLEEIPSLHADIIKLGHHGSKSSSDPQFISSLNPKFALISCGLNNSYHHPSDSVVELLQNLGIIYGRTDFDGAISLIKVTDDYALLRNAAKDKYWLIPKDK